MLCGAVQSEKVLVVTRLSVRPSHDQYLLPGNICIKLKLVKQQRVGHVNLAIAQYNVGASHNIVTSGGVMYADLEGC